MNKKKYLIYVDILGFEELAEDIEKKKGIEEREVRNKFIDVIKERIRIIQARGRIIGKQYGESDDWLLVTDSLDNVFRIVSEILDHNTGYKGYEKIPLEIGIGVAEYDKWVKFSGKDLVVEGETIKLRKTYLLEYYRKWYEKTEKKRIKSTFIVLTESLYHELEPLDKKMCKKIQYEKRKDSEKKEVEVITFFSADVKRVQQRGKIFDFLEKIGYPGSKLYGRIDEIYIPPIEYEEIRETLREKRIVFITGTQEYGKTYTAVRLMWEYFNRGYEPKWIKGEEEKERAEVRQKLVDIGGELKPYHIIYFEDPFGRTRYEKRESLEKEIGTMIDHVKRTSEAYVILTSREEVFKEFEKEKLSIDDIEEFEKRLNLKKPSYDYKKRKEILEKWAENEDCMWFKDKNLRNQVLGCMREKKYLPTPLKIRDFAIATTDINRVDQLEKKIIEKSEETARAFSREIKSMSEDKVLFLSFIFISSFFKVDFVRTVYEELVTKLNLTNAWDFDRVLDWFKDDKIKVGRCLEFSHPSYSEALKYLLIEDGYFTQINKNIFGRVLLDLSKRNEVEDVYVLPARYVAQFIAYNFDNLPIEVRNLLFELAEKDRPVGYLIFSILSSFEKLSESVRDDLLLKLAEKEGVDWHVARAIVNNFDRLPEKVRNLLFRLTEKEGLAGYIAWAVADSCNDLPENVRNDILLKLAEKDGVADCVALAVIYNFSSLPENARNELLLRLAEKEKATRYVARAVVSNFDRLPEELNNLLFKLVEKDRAAGGVAWAVASNFDAIPENVRNELLLKLTRKDRAAGGVAWAVASNFDAIPENIRNELLLKLAKKEKAIRYVARAVANNFDRVPREVRSLLFRFTEKEGAIRQVAWAVASNFNTLPENVRNELLMKLSNKDETAGGVAWAVASNFDAIPEEVRNELLLELAEKDRAAGGVAKAVAENFNAIPENVRYKLLLKLTQKDEAAAIIAKAVAENFDTIPENVRNELLLELAEKDRAAQYVARAVANNFDRLPREVRSLLFRFTEKEGAIRQVAWAVASNFNTLPENVRNELLMKLSNEDGAAEDIAWAVASNFNTLPEDIRNELLLKLVEKDRAVEYVAFAVMDNFSNLPESVRNELLLKLAEKDRATDIAVLIVRENLDTIPLEVRNVYFPIFSEKERQRLI